MKRLLLAIWLSWLAVSLIGCASVRNFSFNDQAGIVFQIPKDVPDVIKLQWKGTNLTLYDSETFKVIAWSGWNPEDPSEKLVMLHAIEGDITKKPGKDWFCYLIGIRHQKHGKVLYWIDKKYFGQGIHSGKFTLTPEEEVPDIRELIKMKTGADPLRDSIERRGPAKQEI